MMRSVFTQSLSDTEESLAPLGPKVAESFFYALIGFPIPILFNRSQEVVTNNPGRLQNIVPFKTIVETVRRWFV